jgi:hypothetical protein
MGCQRTVATLAADVCEKRRFLSRIETNFGAQTNDMAIDAVWIEVVVDLLQRFESYGVTRLFPSAECSLVAMPARLGASIFVRFHSRPLIEQFFLLNSIQIGEIGCGDVRIILIFRGQRY